MDVCKFLRNLEGHILLLCQMRIHGQLPAYEQAVLCIGRYDNDEKILGIFNVVQFVYKRDFIYVISERKE